MKKEYLLPIVLILVLGAYLFLKDDNQTHYQLPTPPGVDRVHVSRLVVKGPDTDLSFKKENGKWQVGENAFPADETAIKAMLDILANLKITALASEKGDLRRYELDTDQALAVTALKGSTELMRLMVGKPSSTGNHTFVMLDGDTKIYHAAKSFRNRFAKPLDDVRDKQVLSFQRGDVKRLVLHTNQVTRTFTQADPKAQGQKKDDEKKGTASALSFVSETGETVDDTAMSDLLSALSDLKCDAFPNAPTRDELEKSPPRCKITLENGEAMVLNLFDQEESVLGTASTTPYSFKLSTYTAKDIISLAEKLTGTEVQKKNSDKE